MTRRPGVETVWSAVGLRFNAVCGIQGVATPRFTEDITSHTVGYGRFVDPRFWGLT